MPRRIAAVWLFLLLLIATCFAQLNMLPHWRLVFKVKNHDFSTTETVANPTGPAELATAPPPTRAPNEPLAKSGTGSQRSDASPASPATANSIKTGIDIARISRDGPSVFAGRSAPNARVGVFDGDKEVATAVANDNGDWSTVTDYKFSAKDPDISLKTMEPEAHGAESGTLAAVPPAPPAISPSASSPAVALMKSFEKVVETAREEAKNSATSGSAPAKVAAAPAVTPVPMTFFYDQDVLTPEGDYSTKLLLEYLKLKHFASVTLSGHADERGTTEYNLDLSKKRLETISRQLHDGGFTGKLSLLPKGSSEPYMGVDRTHYPREDLMQLDRRVELRAAD